LTAFPGFSGFILTKFWQDSFAKRATSSSAQRLPADSASSQMSNWMLFPVAAYSQPDLGKYFFSSYTQKK
jgi:hypothetical protein